MSIPDTRQPNVYIVEDDECLGSTLSEWFAARGAHVRWFGSGEQFLAHYSAKPNTCIFLDVRMCGLSGLDVLRILRERSDQTPVIMHTAHSSIELVVESMKLGAFDFLTKPTSLSDLWDAVIKATTAATQTCADIIAPAATIEQAEPKDLTLESYDSVAIQLAPVITRVGRAFCHDLLNRLCTISSLSQLLLRCIGPRSANGPETADRILSYVLRMSEAADDMSNTLRGLQLFFHGFDTSAEKAKPILSGNEIRPYLIRLFSGVTFESGVSLKLRVTGFRKNHSVPTVLLWVLTKPLIENSVEAHTTSKPESSDPVVSVTVRPIGKSHGLRISITDNGPGWGTSVEHVMEAIRQGRQMSTKAPSRGFSLNNTYSLVSALRGSLDICNVAGGGASIEIRVPWKIDREDA